MNVKTDYSLVRAVAKLISKSHSSPSSISKVEWPELFSESSLMSKQAVDIIVSDFCKRRLHLRSA